MAAQRNQPLSLVISAAITNGLRVPLAARIAARQDAPLLPAPRRPALRYASLSCAAITNGLRVPLAARIAARQDAPLLPAPRRPALRYASLSCAAITNGLRVPLAARIAARQDAPLLPAPRRPALRYASLSCAAITNGLRHLTEKLAIGCIFREQPASAISVRVCAGGQGGLSPLAASAPAWRSRSAQISCQALDCCRSWSRARRPRLYPSPGIR